MNRPVLLAVTSAFLLSPLSADARPIGNPRNLSSNAPAAVKSPEKRAGLIGFLFRKETAPPENSKIAPRRGKRTPGAAASTNAERTTKKKTTLFGILFGE